MHRELRNTVILVSHNMEDVARLAGRIFVMARGRIILSGTPAEVFEHPEKLEEVGLAAPPVSVLMDCLRKKGLDVPKGVFTVEEAAMVLGGKQ
jgi:energy-coupling factor transport system ATP-binding protein